MPTGIHPEGLTSDVKWTMLRVGAISPYWALALVCEGLIMATKLAKNAPPDTEGQNQEVSAEGHRRCRPPVSRSQCRDAQGSSRYQSWQELSSIREHRRDV